MYKAIKTYYDFWDNEFPGHQSISVFEQMPIDTGLIDENEIPIYRVKDPIGFDLC